MSTSSLPGADLYTDFGGFSRLRAQAREGSAEGARTAAEQAEALLLGMMIKSMRAGVGAGASGAGIHQGMFDSQIAINLAKGGRLGFAQMLLGEIAPGAVAGGASTPGAAGEPRGLPAPPRNVALRALLPPVREAPPDAAGLPPEQPAAHATTAAGGAAPAAAAAGTAQWSSPEEFARDLWPAASRAARALGTQPEAVLAVAALETGWGRHMPRGADGRPSFNLFGIKAHGWGGAVTHSPTLEFEQGAFARRVEPFRAYGSPEEAFEDFADFLKSQPRYREALSQAADPVAFVHGLQKAGYATDPRYGEKLESVLRSDVLGRVRTAAADGNTDSA